MPYFEQVGKDSFTCFLDYPASFFKRADVYKTAKI